MFNPNVPGVSSIFELIIKKLKKLDEIARQTHPDCDLGQARKEKVILAVMTSPTNYDAITGFFKQNNNFGYSSLIFFSQPNLPLAIPTDTSSQTATDKPNFQILLNSEGGPIFAPNGNGGLFQ